MKEPKETPPPNTSFHYYTTYLEEKLGRVLTNDEIKLSLRSYITSVSADDLLKEMK